MPTRSIFAYLCVFLLLAGTASAGDVIHSSTESADSAKEQSVLFAFTATDGTYEDGSLVLSSPSLVIYFADRPSRVAGHIGLDDFITLWSKDGRDSFKNDPPNAVVSIPDHSDVVVELQEAAMQDGGVRFSIQSVEGELPARFSECAVFVDSGVVPGLLGVFGHMGN